ncbi:MAG: chemotaxis protein CheW [Arhodomonas sp.]|nr:chemotaxis protein CheW [Arhodomonas sp.]
MAEQPAAALAPFAELRRLQRLGIERGAELPTEEEAPRQWVGIGFRAGSRRFVAPLDEVHEVLDPPPLTRVPHAQEWLKGISNIRGTLLPIVDLTAFLGVGAASESPLARVLVVSEGNLRAGLLVDEVLGMRHFDTGERKDVGSGQEKGYGGASPYVTAVFEHGNNRWPVFSMAALAADPAFLRASA